MCSLVTGVQTRALPIYLPIMVTDIVLENTSEVQRIVIDTKFTSILTPARYGGQRFKTDHLYQLYAYLRSQERTDDPLSVAADGMLLYPAIGLDIDETALIQGHRIRFVTIDLRSEERRVGKECVSKCRS